MKILMQGRFELLESGGGDKVQIVNTAKELKKLGIDVEISTDTAHKLYNYDLVHIFQLDWVAENYYFVKNAQRYGKPVVLSPIHHQFHEVKRFDDIYVFGFRKIAKYLFKNQFSRDVLKNIYRSISDPRKRRPTFLSIFFGLKALHKYVLSNSKKVLVQTKIEAQDLKNIYGVDLDWEIVPNGVGKPFVEASKSSKNSNLKNMFNFKDYIVCVGRIEPRKNQLNIIKAVKMLREKDEKAKNINLVFVGLSSTGKHKEFVQLFNSQLSKHNWIKHVQKVEYKDMPSVYKFAKVGVSASWFESTGLTSLEALVCGTNAVASGEPAREYLGEYASYCDPNDVESIYKALKKEYFAERPKIPESMLKEYTWENAAKKTLNVYSSIIDAAKDNKEIQANVSENNV